MRGDHGFVYAGGIAGALLVALIAGTACGSNDRKPPHFTGGSGGDGPTGGTFAATSSTGFSDVVQCDQNLALEATDPMDGAKAIGLCSGVTKAEWVRADGSALGQGDFGPGGDGDLNLGKGILPAFGNTVKPREGARMLVLSSGSARTPTNVGYHSVKGWWKDNTQHSPPPNYPKASPACPNVVSGGVYDSAGLRLEIQPPETAKGMSFDFDFYTFEFPKYICSTYNDFFVALMTPTPAGLPDANISFDEIGNTISVNAGFLKVCHPQTASDGKFYACEDGPGDLAGTGFDGLDTGVTDNSAATNWLVTKAPITDPSVPITIQFAIWDAGDGVLDSTVLIDNFRFELEEVPVGTQPAPK
ncbi:MAG: choice-of-anchor L domain-containing protein [Polyangiaceae bacterium]